MSSFRRLLLLATGIVLFVGGTARTWTLTNSWSEKEEIRFAGGLRGVWLWPKATEAPYPAVIFANGATGTLEHNLPLAIELNKHGVACFLFDFAGQGGSKAGTEPEADLVEAIDVFRIHPRVDREHLAAVGHSLGARLISVHQEPFRGRVLFGNLPTKETHPYLVAYSRFEFLFDPPEPATYVVGPWTDHLSGPMDPVLLRATLNWLGRRIGFDPVHPLTEPSRIGSRLVALLGGALVLLGLLLLIPTSDPAPGGDAPIPSSFLWITAAGTMILPVLLFRRKRPEFRLSERSALRSILWGAVFFSAVYALAAGAFSWSYFNVLLYPRKLIFFGIMGASFTLIQWHDQTLIHGRLIEQEGFRWRDLRAAALAGSAGRWCVAALVFAMVVLSGGRSGVWMVLAAVSLVTFWLEGFAACLSVRLRHPLAGASFLGWTWSWLWTVFLPM